MWKVAAKCALNVPRPISVIDRAMTDPIGLASAESPKGWSEHLTLDASLKHNKSVGESNPGATSGGPPISRAVVIISFGAKTLRAWLKEPNSNRSEPYRWPNAPLTGSEALNLPAAIAYDLKSLNIVWGFGVPEDHPCRVTNLRTLIEPNGLFDDLRTLARDQLA